MTWIQTGSSICFKPYSLEEALRGLAEAGLLSILVEGGPTVHTAFLREGLADRVAVGVAPLILGYQAFVTIDAANGSLG